VNRAARESLRQHYFPDRVELLFVGEAPPASRRFFYKADSGLFRAIRSTFIAVFPTLRNEEFLESFRSLNCYLVDLCGTSVDRLNSKQRKRACVEAEARLSRILKEISPRIVVTVVRSISANVRRAQRQADWSGAYFELPYPGRWKRNRQAFAEGLAKILRQELAVPGSRTISDARTPKQEAKSKPSSKPRLSPVRAKASSGIAGKCR